MKRTLWILSMLLLVLTACSGNVAPNSYSVSREFYLEIAAPAEGESELHLTIVNASGKTAEILLIPTLEKQNSDGYWEVIEFDDGIGFCGTPDPLPDGETSLPVRLDHLWGDLYAGNYRLSYTITDEMGFEHTVSGEFTLAYDISLLSCQST